MVETMGIDMHPDPLPGVKELADTSQSAFSFSLSVSAVLFPPTGYDIAMLPQLRAC